MAIAEQGGDNDEVLLGVEGLVGADEPFIIGDLCIRISAESM